MKQASEFSDAGVCLHVQQWAFNGLLIAVTSFNLVQRSLDQGKLKS